MAKNQPILTPGKKAARTRKQRAAGKKAALTRKRRDAGRKAAATRVVNALKQPGELGFSATVKVGRQRRSLALNAKSLAGALRAADKFYRDMYPDREVTVESVSVNR